MNAEQENGDEPVKTKGSGDADNNPEDRQLHSMPDYKLANGRAISPQGHADTDAQRKCG
jgi:hypothetical protein